MKQVCESALFHQKNESYPQRGAENAQKDAVASKVYLTFDATAPFLSKPTLKRFRFWRGSTRNVSFTPTGSSGIQCHFYNYAIVVISHL